MYNKKSRILFEDNPYSNGHLIKKFEWSISLIPNQGLWFNLHLETDDYYAEDESDDDTEPDSDWKAKIVWGNYHSCTLSSNNWHNGGFLGGSEESKFNFEGGNKQFHLDQLPRPDDFDINEDPVFCIYLLGHDDCADHIITFKKNSTGLFNINWNGKIALSYSGDYDFNYKFSSEITDVATPVINCPAELSDSEIQAFLNKYSIGFSNIKIVKEQHVENNTDTEEAEPEEPEQKSFWNKVKSLWS